MPCSLRNRWRWLSFSRCHVTRVFHIPPHVSAHWIRFRPQCGQASVFYLFYRCRDCCKADVVREIRTPPSKSEPWGAPTYKRRHQGRKLKPNSMSNLYLPLAVPSSVRGQTELFLRCPQSSQTLLPDQWVLSYLAHSGVRKRNSMLLILKRLGSKSGSAVKQSSGLYLEVNTHSHNQHLQVRELTSHITHPCRANRFLQCCYHWTPRENPEARVGTYLPE